MLFVIILIIVHCIPKSLYIWKYLMKKLFLLL